MENTKFRAWDRKLKVMFPVHKLEWNKIDNELTFLSGVDIHDKDSDWSGDVAYGGHASKMTGTPAQMRFELMQYIGRRDRNGQEICMGDVVEFIDTYHEDIPVKTGVVRFANASYYVDCGHSDHYRWIDYDCLIIGNIYNNPELLQGEVGEA